MIGQKCLADNIISRFIALVGHLENVPLQKNVPVYNRTSFDTSSTITWKVASKEEIASEAAYAASKTTLWNTDSNITNTTSTVELDTTKFPSGLTSRLERGANWGKGNAYDLPWDASYGKAAAFSNSFSDTTTKTFDSTYPLGYYRYVLMGDVEVYASEVYDPKKEIYYLSSFGESGEWRISYSFAKLLFCNGRRL